MGDSASLLVYEAQCENVLAVDKARRQVIRSINAALQRGDDAATKVHTRVLAVVYSTWAEVNFSKLIHTPHGFEVDEIEQIRAANRGNIEKGWNKCLELALKRIGSQKPGELPNKGQELTRLVQRYIIEPSILRNKIAHGQWETALNSENTSINQDISTRLRELDVVKLTILFGAFSYIQRAIEDIIESPEKTHRRDYFVHITDLKQFLAKTSGWTMEKKIRRLREKAGFFKRACRDRAR